MVCGPSTHWGFSIFFFLTMHYGNNTVFQREAFKKVNFLHLLFLLGPAFEHPRPFDFRVVQQGRDKQRIVGRLIRTNLGEKCSLLLFFPISVGTGLMGEFSLAVSCSAVDVPFLSMLDSGVFKYPNECGSFSFWGLGFGRYVCGTSILS